MCDLRQIPATKEEIQNVNDCTYKSTDKEITLDCPGAGAPMTLTRHDDESLSGPPGGAMPILKKTK